MKNLFILIISMFFVPATFGQHTAMKTPWQTRHMQALGSFLQQNTTTPAAAKTTTGITKYRVKAQSTWDNTTVALVDSFDLRYTGLHSSKFDFNTMLYPYNYPYSASPMFNFLGVFTKPQVLYDTCARWTINPFTNVYGPYEINFATYDTANNLKTFRDIFIDSVNNNQVSFANVFNAAHNITTGYWFNLNAGVPDSAFKQYFEYNTANRLVKDSIYERHLGVWRLASKTTYTYDASNNLTQADQFANASDTSFLLPLVEYEKYVNTYDASNRLLTVLTSLYNGTALAASMKDTFEYTGALPFCTSWREQQFDPINNYWAPMINVEKHITGSLPDTINTYSFDSLLNSWLPAQMDIMHYNSVSNPDTMFSYLYSWTSFPATPDYTTIYYYGSYIDASSVPNTALQAKALVYPNPVRDVLTVSLPGIASNTGVVISIINGTGQIMSRQGMAWHGAANIATEALAPGAYCVTIQSADGGMIDSRIIVKQ